MKMERGNGVLCHISSLPNYFGHGCIDKSAYEFIDNLAKCQQKYWQILPLNIVDEYNSPYYSVSQFAFNPLLIDLTEFYTNDQLTNMGMKKNMPYAKYVATKKKILISLCNELKDKIDKRKLDDFIKNNSYWIHDYAKYMTLKDKYISLSNFPKNYLDKNSANTNDYIAKHSDTLARYIVEQYIFYTQWSKLKEYATKMNVKIIGDMPIYCSPDSADVWAYPQYFKVDSSLCPTLLAGVPADYFNDKGQLWGNPIYNYANMADDNYTWWINRIKHLFTLYDYIKIDHFRAFEKYYAIKAGAHDATKGKWYKGIGNKLFPILKQLGLYNFILEDLGIIDDSVRALKQKTNLPGMKIFMFAFDGDDKNIYLPHLYEKNCVAYLGTHDNNTFDGLLQKATAKANICKYLFLPDYASNNQITYCAIERLLASNANVTILRTQDLLLQDSTQRINMPGTTTGNWQYHCPKIPNDTWAYLRDITKKYNR